MSDVSRMMEMFAENDVVRPSDEARAHPTTLRLEMDIEYVVVKVKEVPDKCNCGRPLPDEEHGERGCPYARLNSQYGRSLRDTVGHVQWIVVRPREGAEPIQSPLLRLGPCEFSGKWFTHVN